MRSFVIGDVHGCLDPLQRLLDRLGADRERDRFLFVGDLVNRGPDSLATLEFVRALGERAIVTLGNHDLHLLAVLHEIRKPGRRDTFDDILAAPDRDALIAWLRSRAILHGDASGFVMVHAGIHPHWSLAEARRHAAALENALRGDDYLDFLERMYGNEPARPVEARSDIETLRVAVNVFTRLRYIRTDGALDFDASGPPSTAPGDLWPWYALPGRVPIDVPIVFGHWSAHPAMAPPGIVPLDRGCVWGGWLAGAPADGSSPMVAVAR